MYPLRNPLAKESSSSRQTTGSPSNKRRDESAPASETLFSEFASNSSRYMSPVDQDVGPRAVSPPGAVTRDDVTTDDEPSSQPEIDYKDKGKEKARLEWFPPPPPPSPALSSSTARSMEAQPSTSPMAPAPPTLPPRATDSSHPHPHPHIHAPAQLPQTGGHGAVTHRDIHAVQADLTKQLNTSISSLSSTVSSQLHCITNSIDDRVAQLVAVHVSNQLPRQLQHLRAQAQQREQQQNQQPTQHTQHTKHATQGQQQRHAHPQSQPQLQPQQQQYLNHGQRPPTITTSSRVAEYVQASVVAHFNHEWTATIAPCVLETINKAFEGCVPFYVEKIVQSRLQALNTLHHDHGNDDSSTSCSKSTAREGTSTPPRTANFEASTPELSLANLQKTVPKMVRACAKDILRDELDERGAFAAAGRIEGSAAKKKGVVEFGLSEAEEEDEGESSLGSGSGVSSGYDYCGDDTFYDDSEATLSDQDGGAGGSDETGDGGGGGARNDFGNKQVEIVYCHRSESSENGNNGISSASVSQSQQGRSQSRPRHQEACARVIHGNRWSPSASASPPEDTAESGSGPRPEASTTTSKPSSKKFWSTVDRDSSDDEERLVRIEMPKKQREGVKSEVKQAMGTPISGRGRASLRG
ncbi:hypothetical protein MKZ38_004721 [Zalerion maritima]|uniref:Uncharacterized protein n=1 Tax=Zalerion maritima TaxID=339359 RepID=A0AAD5WUY4_9PEZI|nr:hypothetical protein MKZ38_004721 [Zalerion maritima]